MYCISSVSYAKYIPIPPTYVVLLDLGVKLFSGYNMGTYVKVLKNSGVVL